MPVIAYLLKPGARRRGNLDTARDLEGQDLLDVVCYERERNTGPNGHSFRRCVDCSDAADRPDGLDRVGEGVGVEPLNSDPISALLVEKSHHRAVKTAPQVRVRTCRRQKIDAKLLNQ